jgi:adenylosuccinate synthase
MPLTILVGAQWGDEGKGRIVDWLSAEADVVARFNGGDNAGHTVTVGSQTFQRHLIPSGMIHPAPDGVLGNGMVINLETLLNEMANLEAAGIDVSPQRLHVSHAAHLITPAHRALDQAQEKARGQGKIGTTGRGIGPAYTDKASRRGLRMQDILNPSVFAIKMATHINEVNKTLRLLYNAPELDDSQLANDYADYAAKLAPYVGDVSAFLTGALANGKNVLAEGAQGTLLDLDHGTYPFVTSSSPTAPGALVGLGLGITPVAQVIGATKAFQTRVGEGPFPTEVSGPVADHLRGTGANPWDEFGTTTGRPRRVGWLDAVLLRYAVRINGLTELILTKLDILSGLETLRICTAYRAHGKQYANLPFGPADLSPFEPVYEELPGWQEDLSPIRLRQDLPPMARRYLERIEALAGIPIHLVTVGAERSQVVETG